jgi:[lysine-biosynthesis-protein LysW]--L-2-aminoadipate ligase
VILGISYDVIRWEERDLIEKAKKLGIEVFPIHIPSFDFNAISNVDVIIQRAVSFYHAISSTILMEERGNKVINPSATLQICENKLFTTSLLRRNNIMVPETRIAFSREKALEYARSIGYPVVIKPLMGSWGRMVAKADTEDSLEGLLEYAEYSRLPFYNVFYIQKYVKKPNRDIRVFVIGDEVPVGIYRVNEKNWKTNTALGARAEPLKIDGEINEIALKVKQVIGGFFLGVDLLEDKELGYLVSEVNGVPEYKNTVRVNNYDVSIKLLSSIKEIYRR